jgi:hypothetical protein
MSTLSPIDHPTDFFTNVAADVALITFSSYASFVLRLVPVLLYPLPIRLIKRTLKVSAGLVEALPDVL